MRLLLRHLARLLLLVAVGVAALQLSFAVRVLAMRWIDPVSTTFQRSEAWRLLNTRGRIEWSQEWVDAERISVHLKRAVIASEDAAFASHTGLDWASLEKAWDRNQRAEARAEARAQQQPPGGRKVEPKVVGGSTITQQLAKNLFLSGERTVLRKAQEFVITQMLEVLLPKRRILEIYLNSVEWGEGLFGAQAAARHYFRIDAQRLGIDQAARLAVMLPAPKRFEKRPASEYVIARSATIAARMGAVELP
ncbi:MAG: monofunctional biosynthetic peptidoglycan transglycosylase [Betaproteobacteria bacterium]|jgi:monofunctional biosynthetic peptidoglycan transglycosylase